MIVINEKTETNSKLYEIETDFGVYGVHASFITEGKRIAEEEGYEVYSIITTE